MENAEREESIFREKSMEQLSAPEQLTGYLHVTGPGVWVVLGGVIVLLAGLFVWGMFGTIISSVTVPAMVKDGKASCYVLQEDLNVEDSEVDISIGDVQLKADAKKAKTVTLDASDDPALYESGYLSAGKNALVLEGQTTLTDGFYDAVVITDKLKPISLLFAKN